ncbi:putative signal transducing protein [Rubritalea marina]|uniref:putative signal transducing protein n=1 Tax=Rubritalea marina TaxID=361055 RepID=UPI0003635981|nr:DUF2007 domain-containing protein [Rubritalea marina]
MIEVYRDRDSATIGHLQSLLEAEGISTYLRNEHASSTTIPIPEVTPALCILEEAEVERGVDLIRAYLEAPSADPNEELTCPTCGELSPGTLAVCWSCGGDLV